MLGREVVTTMNVLKVMAVIHARQPRLEMAIVDARLGNAAGLEFLTFLSHHDPRVLRVLRSGEFRPTQLALAKSSKRARTAS